MLYVYRQSFIKIKNQQHSSDIYNQMFFDDDDDDEIRNVYLR
jgi:hypothetical protein